MKRAKERERGGGEFGPQSYRTGTKHVGVNEVVFGRFRRLCDATSRLRRCHSDLQVCNVWRVRPCVTCDASFSPPSPGSEAQSPVHLVQRLFYNTNLDIDVNAAGCGRALYFVGRHFQPRSDIGFELILASRVDGVPTVEHGGAGRDGTGQDGAEERSVGAHARFCCALACV